MHERRAHTKNGREERTQSHSLQEKKNECEEVQRGRVQAHEYDGFPLELPYLYLSLWNDHDVSLRVQIVWKRRQRRRRERRREERGNECKWMCGISE